MTETPQQERVNPEPDPNRLNTENLRNYTALRRTTYDRKIAGVAGGLARHLNIDPVIVRVVFVVLIFFGGAGLILYGAAWLLVPEDDGRSAKINTSDSTRNTLLIIAAIVAGLSLVGDSWGGFGFPWPLFVIALIVFAVMMSRDNAPTAPPVIQPPDMGVAPTEPVGQPFHYTGSQYGWQPVTPATPPSPRKRGPILFGMTLALIAAGLGALGIYDSVADNNVADAAYPALALAIIGAMLVLGSFFGRPGGLIFLGLVASLALAGSAIADPRFSGERELQLSPTFASEIDAHYQVPAGSIELDLRNVKDLAELDGREIELDVNAGEIVVILPYGLSADVEGDVSIAGAITLEGEENGGLGYSVDKVVGDPNAPRIELDIEVKLGHIEVRHAA